jgi:hypothetical protein
MFTSIPITFWANMKGKMGNSLSENQSPRAKTNDEVSLDEFFSDNFKEKKIGRMSKCNASK